MVSVLFALLTALCNGMASVLQRIAAAAAPDSHALHLSLFSYLIRRKVWLVGIGLVIVAAVSQATALATGPVALVQPIFIIELPFTLLVAVRLAHRRLPRRAWWAVGLVTVSLGGGLAAAAPSGGTTQAPLKVWVPTLIVTGCFEAVVIAVGVRTRGNARGAALGLAAACGYALTATLMKSAVSALSHGVLPFFTSWQLYATAVAGVGALFLLQNGLQAGSLVAVQPPLTLGDALISACYGVTVFNENVRTGGWLLVIEIAAVIAVAIGCIELSRSLALMHTADSTLDPATAPSVDPAAELSREPAAGRRLGPHRPRGRLASARVHRSVRRPPGEPATCLSCDVPSSWPRAPSSSCPACGTRAWPPTLAIAAVMAILLGALATRVHPGLVLAAAGWLAACAVPLAFVDAAVRRLPDLLIVPAYAGTSLLLAASGDEPVLLRAVLGGLALAGFYLALLLISPSAMGLGDVKLAASLGTLLAWFGWRPLIAGGAAGFLLGGLGGIALLVSGRATRKQHIPFGPVMIAGAFLVILL